MPCGRPRRRPALPEAFDADRALPSDVKSCKTTQTRVPSFTARSPSLILREAVQCRESREPPRSGARNGRPSAASRRRAAADERGVSPRLAGAAATRTARSFSDRKPPRCSSPPAAAPADAPPPGGRGRWKVPSAFESPAVRMDSAGPIPAYGLRKSGIAFRPPAIRRLLSCSGVHPHEDSYSSCRRLGAAVRRTARSTLRNTPPYRSRTAPAHPRARHAAFRPAGCPSAGFALPQIQDRPLVPLDLRPQLPERRKDPLAPDPAAQLHPQHAPV